MSVVAFIIELSQERLTMRIIVVLLNGNTKTLPYTNSGLAHVKEMFADGNILNWSLDDTK